MKDLVVDANVIRLYDAPADPQYVALFAWVANTGTITISQYLLNEWYDTRNKLIPGLIDRLMKKGRLVKIANSKIDGYTKDRHRKYTCNPKDVKHARLVYLSGRKLLVAFDRKLRNDVNSHGLIAGIKPMATRYPDSTFYA